MRQSRVEKYDHKVDTQELSDNSLYVSWKSTGNFKGCRHNYLIVGNWEEFDILVSEFRQVLENRRHNGVIRGTTKKIKIKL